MPWPTSQDYNEAIQDPRVSLSDPELRRGQAVVNSLGLPMPRTGSFADVYEFRCPGGDVWALKCFTKEIPGLSERYREIGKHLAQAQLPFAVDFQFLEQAINIRSNRYPLLKMRWVDGLLLNTFVRDNLDKAHLLEKLRNIWLRMALRLREARMAHADLQHGNVILVPGSKPGSLAVKLVDYDGMFVPALARSQSGESGHPAYQHPRRLAEAVYSAEVDRFPLLAIHCALRALEVAGRSLWERHDTGDNLLFLEKDFRQPGQSKLIKELWQVPDPMLHDLLGYVVLASQGPLAQTPLLDQVVDGDQVVPLSAAREHLLTAILGPGANVSRRTIPVAGAPRAPHAPSEFDFAPEGLGKNPVRGSAAGQDQKSVKKWLWLGAALGVLLGLIAAWVGGAFNGEHSQIAEVQPNVVSATPPGFAPHEEELTLGEGERTPLTAPLTVIPRDTVVVVETNELDSDVYVDREKVMVTWTKGGKYAEIPVKPGIRKVEVRKEGFKADGMELTLKEGDRPAFKAKLMPVPRDTVLVVETNEADSDVYVDGEKAKVTWTKGGKYAELPIRPGTRKVEVRKDGFKVDGKELTLREGDRQPFTATLTPIPRDTVTVTPTRVPAPSDSVRLKVVNGIGEGGRIDAHLGAVIDMEAKTALLVRPKGKATLYAYPEFKPLGHLTLGAGHAFGPIYDESKGRLFVLDPMYKNPLEEYGDKRFRGRQVIVYSVRDLLRKKLNKDAKLDANKKVPLDGLSSHLCLSPDGAWLYALDTNDPKKVKVVRINLATEKIDGRVEIQESTFSLSLARDGKTLYALTRDPALKAKGAILAIDAKIMKLEKTILLPVAPVDMETTKEGIVFVSSTDGEPGKITVVDFREEDKEKSVVATWKGVPPSSRLKLSDDEKCLFVGKWTITNSKVCSLAIPDVIAGSTLPKAEWVKGRPVESRGEMLLTQDSRFLLCDSGEVFSLER